MKTRTTIAFLLLLLGFTCVSTARLYWDPDVFIDMEVGDVTTVSIWSDDPEMHSYTLTMGADWETGDAAEISYVTPLELAGDMAEAQELPGGWWSLTAGWSGDIPADVSGPHWEVTIKALRSGGYKLNSDSGEDAGENDELWVFVEVHDVPEVIPLYANGITSTTATLWGELVDDGGDECECRFWYIRDDGTDTLHPTEWIGPLMTGQRFSKVLTNLIPDTPYRFGVEVQNPSDGRIPRVGWKYFRTRLTDEVTHKLKISSSLGGSVTDPGEGTFEYEHNASVQVEATAEPNYYFVEWTGTAVNAGKVVNQYAAKTKLLVDADYKIKANFTGELQAPVVTALPATDIRAVVASLNGRIVDDGGQACQYRFRYSRGEEVFQYTDWTGSKVTDQAFSETITGLQKDSLYYFWAQARNSVYESPWSEAQSFNTLKSEPVIFEDSFPSTTIDPQKWPVVYDATIDDVGTNEPSPEYSLRLNGHPLGADLIESRVIDLSSYSGVSLTYYYQRTGLNGNSPEAGEDLIIDYNDGSNWVELDRQLGKGPDMTEYNERTIPLPAAALHSEFKLRLQKSMGSVGPYDDWFVDDIRIFVDASQEPGAASGLNDRGCRQ